MFGDTPRITGIDGDRISVSTLRMGGAIPSGRYEAPLEGVPLRQGADVSWLSRCRPGDNQGPDGACVIFAFANWAEIFHGYNISDETCLSVYHNALRRLGRSQGGLTFPEGYVSAAAAKWLPGSNGVTPTHDLGGLVQQPILAGYTVTPSFDRPNAAGCLDHTQAYGPSRGLHAVDIVGHGEMTGVSGGPYVYIENSWGPWGYKGLGLMSEVLHRVLCKEMWLVV